MSKKEITLSLSSLKEGDSVGVKNNGKYPPAYYVGIVEKTTKAFIFVDGVKFKKEDGCGYPADKRDYSLCSVGQAKEGIDYREQYLRQYQSSKIVEVAKTLASSMNCDASDEFIADVQSFIEKYKGKDYFYNNMNRI